MNWSQIAGILRIAGPALVGVLAQTGVISDSLATNLSAFILTVAEPVEGCGIRARTSGQGGRVGPA